jgi:hypothetical protein
VCRLVSDVDPEDKDGKILLNVRKLLPDYNEVFSGGQSCEYGVGIQWFGDCLCPDLRGVSWPHAHRVYAVGCVQRREQ